MWGWILSAGSKAMGSVTGNWKTYLIGMLLLMLTSGAAYFGLKLADKNQMIGDLGIENAQLVADKLILKGNLRTMEGTLKSHEKDFLRYKELNEVADEEVVTLRADIAASTERTLTLERTIAKLREDKESEEAKILSILLTDKLIDAWNNDGVLDTGEGPVPASP